MSLGLKRAVQSRIEKDLSNSISLHGKAWLSIDEFVRSILSEDQLQNMDELYDGKEFYPSKVIEFARQELNRLYQSQYVEEPMEKTQKERL